jgi:hypothetical protein|tara:strand:- start:1328 stop:1777 length:450 start_codon:yes stop_codon:yes gene_type:complete
MGEVNIQSENKLNVDFSGVEGKKKIIIPEGNYPATVVEAKAQTSKAGNPMVVWVFQIDGGEYNGQKFFYNTVLLPQSLWNFRNTLEACGVAIEGEGAMDIPLDKLTNRKCALAIVDGEWDGQKRSEVNDVFSRDLLSETPVDSSPTIEL